jgi:hypothetical protein
MRSQELQVLLEERRQAIDHLHQYDHLLNRARWKARILARRMSREKAARLSTVDHFARQFRRAKFTRNWIDERINR